MNPLRSSEFWFCAFLRPFLRLARTRTMTYPSGRIVTETKDSRDRLWDVSDTGGMIAQYSYDNGNRVSTRTYSNGVVATYTYNANNWITNLTHVGSTLIAGFTHDYDNEGNKKYEQKLHQPSNSEAYQYDSIYQVTGFAVGQLSGNTIPSPTRLDSWQIDPVGNWNQYTSNGVVQARTHNAANELTAIASQALTYDANGNLTGDGRFVYSWDEANRMTAAEGATNRVENVYDTQWRRVIKRVYTGTPGNWTLVRTHQFAYDDWNMIEEAVTQDSGATVRTYVWGADVSGTVQGAGGIGGLLTADLGGGNVVFYHYDARGNVVALTDGIGALTGSYQYDAYGNSTSTSVEGQLCKL